MPPPNGLSRYRVISGPDEEGFNERVSEMLALEYELHGSPGVTAIGPVVILAQAVVWPSGVVSANLGD